MLNKIKGAFVKTFDAGYQGIEKISALIDKGVSKRFPHDGQKETANIVRTALSATTSLGTSFSMLVGGALIASPAVLGPFGLPLSAVGVFVLTGSLGAADAVQNSPAFNKTAYALLDNFAEKETPVVERKLDTAASPKNDSKKVFNSNPEQDDTKETIVYPRTGMGRVIYIPGQKRK